MTLPDEPYYEMTEERLIWLNQTLGVNALCFVWLACKFTDDVKAFCLRHGMSRASFYKACKEMHESNMEVPIQIQSLYRGKGIECIVRDRLHEAIGGLVEVMTPVGRIDLLTETEIIEVKRYRDWKSALGQLLAYSNFYPSHQKRLHLFADAKALSPSAELLTICKSMDVTVTFETVGEVESDA